MSARKSDFEINLSRANSRVLSRTKESTYVKRYLPTLISHVQKIIDSNPGITAPQIQEKLFSEIDNYATTVYENAYVFACYMEYISCQYLQEHKDKYIEISEKLKKSDTNYNLLGYQDCSTFDEYLSLYVYSLKKDLFGMVFEGYLDEIPENYKNFDELLEKHKDLISKPFFTEHFDLPEFGDVLLDKNLDHAKKLSKMREMSTWYKSPISRAKFIRFAKLFMYGSFSFLKDDQQNTETNIRSDLAISTSKIIEQLESLDHLDDYLASYLIQMCQMGFSEYASPICKNGKIDRNTAEAMKYISSYQAFKRASELVDSNKLKRLLSKNFLSSKSLLSLESLLALNSFWSNRYIKELDLYSEAMFAIHEFGVIDKLLSGEAVDISEDDIYSMLIKMNTFYRPASFFIEEMQRISDQTEKDVKEFTDDVEDKIVRYSYEPFLNDIKKLFGNEYTEYFSQLLPNSSNDLADDANWYIRLYNPIHSSYSMKNESINALISSIDNSKTSSFANAGAILDDITSDGTTTDLSNNNILIGIDANLSFPIRIHCRKDVLIDFLKSVNGTALLPVYEGDNDFRAPGSGKPLSAHIIVPFDKEHSKILKKALQNINSYEHPEFITHLGFTDAKRPPSHLATYTVKPNGKKIPHFVTKYVDLETGILYTKDEGNFLKVVSSKKSKEEDSYGTR